MLEEATFYRNLGESIRDFRRKEKISQEALANYLNLSRISILNIEKGKQKVQIYTLHLIAKHLKISIDDLMPKKSIDIITNKVMEKVIKAGGDDASMKKIQGFIDNVDNV